MPRSASVTRRDLLILLLALCALSPTLLAQEGGSGAIVLRLQQGSDSAEVAREIRRVIPSATVAPWLPAGLLSPSPTYRRGRLPEIETRLASLRSLLIVRWSGGPTADRLATSITSLDGIAYAEPVRERRLFFQPNDPLSASQWYIPSIGLESAWEEARCDSSMLIGVVDTGFDPDIPDLAPARWRNPGENGFDASGRDRRSNGVDDDGNGLVDDWRGYDFGGSDGLHPDNDPTPRAWHGSHVAGIVGAAGDDATGMIGVAFGARLLNIKATNDSPDDPIVFNGIQGILYAARMGARVVVCSWGGIGRSRAEEEVIETVLAMGTSVVAAAGNSGVETEIYPAAYPGVIAVGASDRRDLPAGFGNTGPSLTLLAPGSGITSTVPLWAGNGGFREASGTSMAAPVAAGVAALMIARNPSLTPGAVAGILRATCDPIADTRQNTGLLGGGRINAARAVTAALNGYGITLDSIDLDGAWLAPGEERTLRLHLTNHLRPIGRLALNLEPVPGSILGTRGGTVDLGSVESGARLVVDEPLSLVVPSSAPIGSHGRFLIVLRDGDSVLGRWSRLVPLNPPWSTTAANDLAATFSASGRIGTEDFPTSRFGDGVRLPRGRSLLAEGGLLIGTGAEEVADAVRGEPRFVLQRDFLPTLPYRVHEEGEEAIGEGSFDVAPSHPLAGISVGLATKQRRGAGLDSAIIVTARITNRSERRQSSLHLGLYLDWDISVAGVYDRGRLLALARGAAISTTRGTGAVAGGALLSNQPLGVAIIDNAAGDQQDGWSDREKWESMRSGISRAVTRAGDCSTLLTAGPIDLEPGGDTLVTFVIAAAASEKGLEQTISAARARFVADGGTPGPPLVATLEPALLSPVPNPSGGRTSVTMLLPSGGRALLELYDTRGARLATLFEGELPPGPRVVTFDCQELGIEATAATFLLLRIGGTMTSVPFLIEK